MVEKVREKQDILKYYKEKFKDFLEKSWANMTDIVEKETQDQDTSIDDGA